MSTEILKNRTRSNGSAFGAVKSTNIIYSISNDLSLVLIDSAEHQVLYMITREYFLQKLFCLIDDRSQVTHDTNSRESHCKKCIFKAPCIEIRPP
jgi:hypothetical protein